jgi:plastocyanin domain-containing protein
MRPPAVHRAIALLLLAAVDLGCQRASRPVEVTVTRNGFEPALIRVEKGRAVDLIVTRRTDATCATEIVIPDAGLNVPLPLQQPVRVSFTPTRAGRLRFSCAMGMFGGAIEVR